MGRCAELAVGVEQVGDVLGEQFLSAYTCELRPHELRTVLRAYTSRAEPPPLYADGAWVQLNGEVGVAVDGVAEAIGSFVARTWPSSERGKVVNYRRMYRTIAGNTTQSPAEAGS